MSLKIENAISSLKSLFPLTHQGISKYIEDGTTLISVGSSSETLSISVDHKLPFTIFLSKEGAPFARGKDLGDYKTLEISMRDGTSFKAESQDDQTLLNNFESRMSLLQ